MIKSSLSVSMHAAVQAWCLRPPSDASQESQITAHAVAHGVSVQGLRLALRRANLIAPVKPRQQAAA